MGEAFVKSANSDREVRERIRSAGKTSFWVDAGAGTGKTRLLLERLLFLVLVEKVPLTRIAAITFTEKAAAELLERLRIALEEAAEKQSENFAAERALRQWPFAVVSTIHAFCARILREHPFEAGLDPHFRVLDQAQADLLEADCWEEWLGRELRSPKPFLENFWKIYGGVRRMDDLKALLKKHLPRVSREILPWETRDVENFFVSLKDAVERLCVFAEEKCRSSDDRLFLWAKAWQKLLEWKEPVAEAFWRGPDFNGSKKGSLANWASKEDLEKARGVVQSIEEKWKKWKGDLADRVLQETVEWLRGYLDFWKQRKYQSGFLEFDDLLLETRNLLRDHPDIRKRWKRKFRYLFVDEFQDTDPLQAQIMLFLVEAENQTAPDWDQVQIAKGKLFCVGDPKQSIYAFRNADLDFYEAVRRRVLSLGVVLQTLSRNFRTTDTLLDWVNRSFSEVFQKAGMAFSPLEAERKTSGGEEKECKTPIVVEVPDKEEKGAAESEEQDVHARRAQEARTIAAFLAESIRGKRWVIQDPRTKEKRPAAWGDVAVLFRTIQNAEAVYEDAFRALDIPFEVTGGRRFFHRPEIAALETLLTCLSRPSDEAAVTAVLRGPLVGLTDGELLDYRRKGGKFHVGEKKEGPVGEALTVLGEWLKDIAENSPAKGLEKLMEKVNLPALLACQPHGAQRLANLAKLLEQVHDLEENGLVSYRALARWLRLQRREEVVEEEALLPGTIVADRVQLMTIHQAKGLEFPIVVLSGIAPSIRRGRTWLWHSSKQKVVTAGAKGSQDWETEGFSEVRAQVQKKEEEEELRLLYVGCTRARDVLIFPDACGMEKGYFLRPLAQSCAFQNLPRVKPKLSSSNPESPTWGMALKEDERSSLQVEDFRARRIQRRREWEERRKHDQGFLNVRRVSAEILSPEKENVFSEEESFHAAVGRAVHRLLELYATAPVPIEKLAAWLAREEGLTFEQEQEILKMFRRAAEGRLEKRAQKSMWFSREYPVSLHDRENGVWLGVVDLVFAEDDGLVVVDYKTGKEKVEHHLQVRKYAEFLEKALNRKVKEGWLCYVGSETLQEVPVILEGLGVKQ